MAKQKSKSESQPHAQLPNVTSSQLTHLLSTLRPAARVPRPVPPRNPKPVPKYYRTLTETDVKRLVHARFNSLTDCTTVHMSFPAIAKRHRLPVSTCFYAIRAYQQRGFAFINKRLTNGRPHHTIKIKEQLTSFLLCHTTLQEWSGMTLCQRCKQIKNQFGVTISPSALKRFYNRQGIKYLRTSYIYQQGMGLLKEQERFKFCLELSTRLDRKEVIVYADEASFNCWMHSKRTWTGPELPVKIVLNKSRNKSVTVFGAISAAFTYPVFKQYKSTNSDDFLNFVSLLRDALLPEHKDKSLKLVLDGAAAHKRHDIRAYCHFNNIEIVWMPSYSPEFNSIESLWAIIK